MLDGLVGLVVGDFKFAGGRMVMIGPMVKSAVGQRTAEALVEEPEPERDLQTFGRETVGIAGTVAFEQAVTLQLAEIVSRADGIYLRLSGTFEQRTELRVHIHAVAFTKDAHREEQPRAVSQLLIRPGETGIKGA